MRRVNSTTWRLWALGSGLLAAVLGLGLPAAGEAAGPWGAQVVDAETGQPLPDVAAIGVWYRRAVGHPELVTITPDRVVGRPHLGTAKHPSRPCP